MVSYDIGIWSRNPRRRGYHRQREGGGLREDVLSPRGSGRPFSLIEGLGWIAEDEKEKPIHLLVSNRSENPGPDTGEESSGPFQPPWERGRPGLVASCR